MGAPARNPKRFHALVALVACAALTVALWGLIDGRWLWRVWLVCWLAAVNLVTLVYYAFDKARAVGSQGRVPEVVLHGLSAVGGSPAAFLAMWLFRHKTIKGSFRILFWCIVTLQVLLTAWLVKVLWWE